MIAKILCPTDFSTVATNAVNYACKISKAASAKLTLLHVLKKQPIFAGHDVKQPSIDEVEASLHDTCNTLSEQNDISCTCEVEPEIQDFKNWIIHRSQFFDLIVMGSNGADNLEQLLLGSNAYNVMQKTKIPTLVVPEKFKFSNIRRIVYAYDYNTQKLPPLKQVKEFAALFHAKVAFLTIVEKYTPEVEDRIDHSYSLIQSNFEQSDSEVTFNYIYYADVVRSLGHYYQMWSDNDLLVLAAHHQKFINLGFRRSVIRQITNMVEYPVLVVHE